MKPETAIEIYDAWVRKLQGRAPSQEERKIMDRYLNIANGDDPDMRRYDPTQEPDDEDDV
ncbi:hypothetical protein FHX08_002095 [Rhizobium sp. BK529]|nr:hypothetical protein [Rhizobium sp. BK529]